MVNTLKQGFKKKQLLQEFKSNIHLKFCWTIEEFSVLTGYRPGYISEQLNSDKLKKFLPPGSKEPKITRQARDEWFERNSFYDNTDLVLIKKAIALGEMQ